jgi:hypothetical protein
MVNKFLLVNIVEADSPQITIQCLRIACWVNRDTNTLRIFSTRCFPTAIIVQRQSLSVTLHVLFVLLVTGSQRAKQNFVV